MQVELKKEQEEKYKRKSRSPIPRSPIRKSAPQVQKSEENQTAFIYNQIEKGIDYYQKQQYPLSKVILVNASQSLLPLIKKIVDIEKPLAFENLNKALNCAEECSKRIDQMQKQIAASDPYYKQIIETAMIRKCDVKFDDIVGLENIKNQLEEVIVLPNLRPDIFTGIRAPPKGILFYGPPGNGKTLLAKAVANQIKCCFFNVSASTLVQKHLGEGEKLMKALFTIAFKFQPSVIFIDEIDSILSSRSSEEHEASRRLKTEFLVSFDGMQTSDQDRVYLIAATNRPQDIDAAVLRRFTVKVLIDQPEEKARMAMLKTMMQSIKHTLLEGSFNLIVQKLKGKYSVYEGYSASDIKAVVKEACMQPFRDNIDKKMIMSMRESDIQPVRLEDFMKAIEKVKPCLTQKQYQEYISFQKDAK